MSLCNKPFILIITVRGRDLQRPSPNAGIFFSPSLKEWLLLGQPQCLKSDMSDENLQIRNFATILHFLNEVMTSDPC